MLGCFAQGVCFVREGWHIKPGLSAAGHATTHGFFSHVLPQWWKLCLNLCQVHRKIWYLTILTQHSSIICWETQPTHTHNFINTIRLAYTWTRTGVGVGSTSYKCIAELLLIVWEVFLIKWICVGGSIVVVITI